MKKLTKLRVTLCTGTALLCLSQLPALAQGVSRPATPNDEGVPANTTGVASTETVVVTSSRVIADAANSPTPLTIVTTAQLAATTPTNLADGLNKLPAFVGSFSPRSTQNASNNSASNSLNLRSFGAERVLVLLDGHRVTPSNDDDTVDVAGLPQMLVQRVDVVTGGASAVYGSDAVTGVVNFILDKHFTGWKIDANAGISNYEDGAVENFGIAAGSDLFGGRGHIEGDVRVYHADNVWVDSRQNGSIDPLVTGAGTATNRYTTTLNVRDPSMTFGGKITCTGCAANGQQFIANGIIGPFNPGLPTGSALQSGGDGARDIFISLAPLQSSEESFLRFSYNVNDDVNFYVQGAITQSYNKATFKGNIIGTGPTSSTFFSNNPYLPSAAQALLANPSGKFTENITFENQGPWGNQITAALENNDEVTAGLDGVWGKYNWSLFYTHGESRSKVGNPRNMNAQKMWAANDAVAGPGGTVQCYVSTTTYASLYPGCVPMNPFGPTALTSGQFNYFSQSTNFVETHTLDNLGGSIAGEIFDGWAGPVKAALSAETRWTSLSMISSAQPAVVDCTGLRLCNTTTPLFPGTTVSTMPEATENVWEIAGEVNVPLIKNVPLVQELNVDFAGRYTDYSTSGSVETWKIGIDYHVNDEVRFRATNSVDIRAPNLYELFYPLTVSHGTISDIHTNSQPGVSQAQGGNPNLVPEIARTYTAGIVLTPDFVPGLTASVDYYRINMTNAVTSVTGSSPAILAFCEASGGTSIYCSLIQRPLPFSNTTTNNQPTVTYVEGLNAAYQKTEGWDLELNYAFQLGDVWQDAPGSVNLRMLANIQPVLESVPFATSPVNFASVNEFFSHIQVNPTSKGHVTSFLTYNLGSWSFNLLDRWMSGYPKALYYGLYYTQPRVNSANYQDVTIDKKFTIDDQTVDGYLSIQNVGNVQMPLNVASSVTSPGDTLSGSRSYDRTVYDGIGRFFTIGVKARF